MVGSKCRWLLWETKGFLAMCHLNNTFQVVVFHNTTSSKKVDWKRRTRHNMTLLHFSHHKYLTAARPPMIVYTVPTLQGGSDGCYKGQGRSDDPWGVEGESVKGSSRCSFSLDLHFTLTIVVSPTCYSWFLATYRGRTHHNNTGPNSWFVIL